MNSHRRASRRPKRLAMIVAALGVALVGGLVAAPYALAKIGSRVSLYPSATIYSGQAATLTAAAYNGSSPAADRWARLEVSYDTKTFSHERYLQMNSQGFTKFSVKPGKTAVYRVVYGNETAATSYSSWARVTVIADRGTQIVANAKASIGKGYSYGASGPNLFDCSGFTQFVVRNSVGKALPHSATKQYQYGAYVPSTQRKPGDLLFWGSGSSKYHVAIYVGNNQIIDASDYGVPVRVHGMWGTPAARRLA